MAHYAIDSIEAYPDAQVIPTVLFTNRKKWRKDVLHELESRLSSQLFIYFKYVFVKLFDFKARDYYDSNNPVVKILLPKMDYNHDERIEVITQAYKGLYDLASHMMFDKYIDFIDIYAGISENERDKLYYEITEHKETAMLAQYIRDKGIQQGIQQGIQEGIQEGIQQGIQKGVQKNLKNNILKMYQKGMTTDQISDILEIEKEKVLVLIKEGKMA